jgi:hypothetical protein
VAKAFKFVAQIAEATFFARIDRYINTRQFLSRDTFGDASEFRLCAAALISYANSFEATDFFGHVDEDQFLAGFLAGRFGVAATAILGLSDNRAGQSQTKYS